MPRSRASPRQREETLRIAEMLDHHGDDARLRRGEQVLEEILDAVGGLVAGRDRDRHVEPVAVQAGAHDGRHGAALRHDGDAGPAQRLRLGDRKGDADVVGIIDVAEAVRAFDGHAAGARDGRDLVLHRLAGRPELGKAGREDDDAADAALGATLHRVEHAGGRNGQHDAIDAVRQIARRSARRACPGFRRASDGSGAGRRKNRTGAGCRARSLPASPASRNRRRSPRTSD